MLSGEEAVRIVADLHLFCFCVWHTEVSFAFPCLLTLTHCCKTFHRDAGDC